MAGKLQRLGKPVAGAPRRRSAGGHRRSPRSVSDEPRASHLAGVQGERQGRARRSAIAVGAARHRDRRSWIAAAPTVAKLPEFEALRDSARDIKNHTLAHLDLYLEQFEQRCTAAGGNVHYAVTADEARAKVLEICRKANAKLVTKGKSMIGEEIAINDFLEAERHRAGRDRSRRIPGADPPRAALAHHHAGGASHPGADRGGLPPRAHASAGRPQSGRAADPAHRGARDPARPLPRGGRRHHRREFPDRRDRHVDHRHQRGQRRPDADLAARAHRARLDREGGADAGGRVAIAARAGALGDRAGDVGLHDVLHRPAPRRRSGRAERVSRHHPRQRPHRDARRPVPRDAALHPLRRLHEPLPGLCGGRRAHLWLGLSGADGRGADARASSASRTPAICRTRRPSAGAARKSARCASRCRS